jgi:hypothetical protein
MVNDSPAAVTSPTNFLREMRFLLMATLEF